MQSNKNRLNIEKIIAESLQRQSEQRREYSLFGRLLYLHDHLMFPVNVQAVIDDIESIIPIHLFEEVDEIMIGDFDLLISVSKIKYFAFYKKLNTLLFAKN